MQKLTLMCSRAPQTAAPPSHSEKPGLPSGHLPLPLPLLSCPQAWPLNRYPRLTCPQSPLWIRARMLTRERRAVRNGKGEAELATLIEGRPPAQPSDTRLGRASGAAAQVSGLQSREQCLQGECRCSRCAECKPGLGCVEQFLRVQGCYLLGSWVSLGPKRATSWDRLGRQAQEPLRRGTTSTPHSPSYLHGTYLKESHRLPKEGWLSRGSRNSSNKRSMS